MDTVKKPQTAYNYFIRTWTSLTEEQKKPFQKQARTDQDRYLSELKVFIDIEENKTRKKEIFIKRSYGRVPCIGMDNGFESFEVIGPAEKLVEYTEKDFEKFKKHFDELKEYGTVIPKYKSISVNGLWYHHNLKIAKKYDCSVYTTTKNIHKNNSWWGITDSKKQEHYTETYNFNMMGDKKWRSQHKNTWRATTFV